MVNWTYASRTAEDNNVGLPGKFDLPVPSTGMQCLELIEEIDEVLGYFEFNDEQLDDELKHFEYDLRLALDRSSPMEILERNYSDDWTSEIQVLMFRNEVLSSLYCGHTDNGYKNFLIQICQEYLTQLYKYHKVLTGEDIY